MTLLLRLWKDGNPAGATEHPFEQDAVGIGRDPSNALPLERPNVSKNHARVEQRADGLFVTDLKSRNGTYVNGVRIPPEDPHPLSVGDRVRVCEYILEVASWDRPVPPQVVRGIPAPEEPPEQEVLVAGENPLPPASAEENDEVAAAERATVDGGVAAEYEERLAAAEGESGRLKDEIAEFEKKLAAGEEERGRLKDDLAALEQKAIRLLAAEEECARLKSELSALEQKLAALPAAAQGITQVDESTALSRLKAVVEAALAPVLKIMRSRIHFRAEFTGATMFQDPEMEAVSKQTPEECMQYFLDAGLSDEKARERLELLILETREIIPHVIGLLDGYRKSVDVGTKQMLQQLNPVRLREEISKKPVRVGPLSIPHKFLPLIADRIAWKAIVQKHRELQEEDRGILEQRFFRPGFIQGYISLITSAKHEPLPSRSKAPTRTKAKP